MTPRQQNLLIVLVALVIGGFMVTITLVSHHNAQMGSVTTVTVPSDMTLTLDGKKVKHDSTFRVKPGDHTFVAKRSGFADLTKKFSIKKGEKQSYNLFLAPNSPEGYKYMTDHPDEQYKIEAATGEEYQKNSDTAAKNNPILKDLPVIENTFRIDYGTSKAHPDDPTALALYITVSDDQGKADAMDWFKTFGYDPSKYEIIYQAPQN